MKARVAGHAATPPRARHDQARYTPTQAIEAIGKARAKRWARRVARLVGEAYGHLWPDSDDPDPERRRG